MMKLGEVARVFGVHPCTVRKWADNGKLECRRTPGGTRIFDEDDVYAFLDTFGVKYEERDRNEKE